MKTIPNRISAFAPLTPGREVALARDLLNVRSEQELDRFLPLLAAAAPMIANVAGPLLKNLAGGLFGGGGGKRKKRPRDEQEHFLGGIIGKLFGGRELEAEQEQFLGGIIGKLFGGRELEAENYVQEQFLGGLLKGLMSGEAEQEGEVSGEPGRPVLMRRARRFVRFVHEAAAKAAADLTTRGTHRPPASPTETQQIVLNALIGAAHSVLPRLAAHAFAAQGGSSSGKARPGGAPTVLELMLQTSPPGAKRNGLAAAGYPLG